MLLVDVGHVDRLTTPRNTHSNPFAWRVYPGVATAVECKYVGIVLLVRVVTTAAVPSSPFFDHPSSSSMNPLGSGSP